MVYRKSKHISVFACKVLQSSVLVNLSFLFIYFFASLGLNSDHTNLFSIHVLHLLPLVFGLPRLSI